MKKNIVINIIGSLIIIGFLGKICFEKNFHQEMAVYINDEYSTEFPKKGEALFSKAICNNDAKVSWNNDSWSLLINNLNQKTKCNLYFYQGETVFNFDYTGSEQVFTAPVSGTYKLETWGAQGATDSKIYNGGYGGYSAGSINLMKNEKLYIIVGEKGKNVNNTKEVGIFFSYPNGGKICSDGNGSSGYEIIYSSGGGSTHISKENKLISELSPLSASLLIVSGGGGGSCNWWKSGDNAGSGGGYIGSSTIQNYNGNNSTGGTENSGGTYGGNGNEFLNGYYGQGGGDVKDEASATSGSGGGGYYGGGASWGGSGAGGSGYIGNSLLKDKAMYCYNCEESNEESTKTISTTCSEETPTENCAKKGNGYARITLVSIDE